MIAIEFVRYLDTFNRFKYKYIVKITSKIKFHKVYSLGRLSFNLLPINVRVIQLHAMN